MVKGAYSYRFHCSDYRTADKRWACYHGDDETYYWNGKGPDKYGNVKEGSRITYGKTPNAAWEKMEKLNESAAVV